MNPIILKSLDTITEAGKDAVSLIINKTTGDNHPEYEKAVISGTSEAIKELAKSDISTNIRIYESLKNKREQRDFYNFSKILQRLVVLIKNEPKEKIEDDNDVFWGLLEHSKEISNEEMQELIAKIIAGEYNNPETYSMSTLQVLKSLDSKLLKEFEQMLSFSLFNNSTFFIADFFSTAEKQSKVRLKNGINYSIFTELQNLGLIRSASISYSFVNAKDQNILFGTYKRKQIFLRTKNDSGSIPNKYELTFAGQQIAQHLNPTFNQDFIDWLKENYTNSQFEVIVD